MTNGYNDSVNELITKHLAGETSADEQKQLLSWINESQANKQHFDQLQKAFGLTERHFKAPVQDVDMDIDQEWAHFTKSIGKEVKVRRLSFSQVSLRVAATVLLLAVAGTLLYNYLRPDNTIYQTAENKNTISLPDGSQVVLNRYTTLSVDPDFGEQNRTVSLEGEAFFNVEANADKPFIILAETASVQVLGTSFNINAYDSLNEVEVTVETGIVTLQARGGTEKVKLGAGQKGIYSKTKQALQTDTNTDLNYLSWNTGRIVFVGNDLRSVIETLRRTYNADITLPPDIPETCIVTVTFEGQSLESVLKVLESTLNIRYSIRGNKVEITEAGC
jgi:transmembrane sensor